MMGANAHASPSFQYSGKPNLEFFITQCRVRATACRVKDGDDSSDDESDSDSESESESDSDTDTDTDSDSGVSETEAEDYARVVRVLAEDLADYQPPHKRVRFSIGTGNIPNSESNSCFRSIRVPSTPTTDN